MIARVGLVVVIPVAAILFYAARDLPVVGDPASAPATHVSPRYIEQGPEETGAANMVTGVLADYRGYDTLGELTVIFTAGIACLLILAGRARRSRVDQEGGWTTLGDPETPLGTDPDKTAGNGGGGVRAGFGSSVLEAAARLLAPFMVLFAVYVVIHGHDSPGGGFQGGVILAAAMILIRLVRGFHRPWGLGTRGALLLACLGTGIYMGIGLLAMVFGGNYLDYGALPLPMEVAEVRAAGTLGIEIGVSLGVSGVILVIFDTLSHPVAGEV
jgi:multicomponent Na+:H+ antiporter subunit B